MMTQVLLPKARTRDWLALGVLALPTLLLAMDISILFLALPNLSADLGASSTQQLWISDIYGFMVAGFLVTMGTLGDRIGRRRLLLIGGGSFAAASILAAFSLNAWMLIASRAVLGIAGATLTPSALALIGNIFVDPKERAVAISLWTSCFMGGVALGPVLGGFMLSQYWWGSAFLLGVPVMGLLLILGPRILPEFRNPNAGRLDVLSIAVFLLAVLPAIFGLKEIARNGWRPEAVVALGLGLAFGAACLLRQRRLRDPLFDIRLFANRNFSAVLGVVLFVAILQSGVLLLVNLYLQLVADLSPFEAGLRLLFPAVAMIGAMLVSPLLARRFRPGFVIACGLAMSAVGYLIVAGVHEAEGLTRLVLGLAVINVGIGPASALGYDVVLASTPRERAGSASGVAETSGEFGVAMGIALLGTLGAIVYRAHMTGTVQPDVDTGFIAAARENLAGAVSAAARLPRASGAELLAVARSAFTASLNVVAGLCAVLITVLSLVAAIALRGIGATKQNDSSPAGTERPGTSRHQTESTDVAVDSCLARTKPTKGGRDGEAHAFGVRHLGRGDGRSGRE